MKNGELLDHTELRIKAIEALSDALGPAAALRFLAMHHRDRTDNVEISRGLYNGQTIDEIFDRAKKSWPKESRRRDCQDPVAGHASPPAMRPGGRLDRRL